MSKHLRLAWIIQAILLDSFIWPLQLTDLALEIALDSSQSLSTPPHVQTNNITYLFSEQKITLEFISLMAWWCNFLRNNKCWVYNAYSFFIFSISLKMKLPWFYQLNGLMVHFFGEILNVESTMLINFSFSQSLWKWNYNFRSFEV